MWKTLHQLAAPPRLYQICGSTRAVAGGAAGIIALATGWVRFGFRPRWTTSRGGLPHYVPACPGGQLSMGIYAAMAVAAFTADPDEMATSAVAAMALVGRCTPSPRWSARANWM